jgi:hypothetical protein
VAIALAGGGYGGVALGLSTIAVWFAVIVAVLVPGETRVLARPFVIAAAALVVLVVLSALSLGWSIDRETGFTDVVRIGAYLGVFLIGGLLLRPGSGRSALAGVGGGLVAVSLLALGSRLLGIGAGDAELVATMPSSAGRLSYPVGYWNALGSIAAMAVPVMIWLAATTRSRVVMTIALVSVPPVIVTADMTSSRGALVAAAIGVLIVIAASKYRARAVAAVAIAVFASAPAIVAVALEPGILAGPGSPPGRAELVVCLAMLAGILTAGLIGPGLVARTGQSPVPGLRMRHLLVAAMVAMTTTVALVGAGEIAGDFAVTAGREATPSGNQLSVSGSGRAQFWSTALEAFEADPLRGIGGGSFGLWWNRHGTLETSVQSVHSEPLELLAELGPLGLAAFLVFFGTAAVAGIPRARRRDGSAAAAALGLVTTGLVGVAIDWTWDVPAVAIPMLLAAAVLTGRSLASADPAMRSSVPRQLLPVPAPLLAVGASAFALAAVWAGGTLAITTDRLESSRDAAAVGNLAGAAADARSAAAVQPWAAEPWIRMATIEQAAGNLTAARLAVERAIRLAPDDFRPWLLAATIDGESQTIRQFYGTRALMLAPLVLSHVQFEPTTGSRPSP